MPCLDFVFFFNPAILKRKRHNKINSKVITEKGSQLRVLVARERLL